MKKKILLFISAITISVSANAQTQDEGIAFGLGFSSAQSIHLNNGVVNKNDIEKLCLYEVDNLMVKSGLKIMENPNLHSIAVNNCKEQLIAINK